MVIGTRLSLKNPNSKFVTEPINVTINPYDEYHAFIMANNTSSGRYISIEFGSSDSLRGRPLFIVTANNNQNVTYQILSREINDVHVTLLAITFDEVTHTEFLARASRTITSDSGNQLVRVRFTYDTYNTTETYIELARTQPLSTSTLISHTSCPEIVPTTTGSPTLASMTVDSVNTSATSSTFNTMHSSDAATRVNSHVTTIIIALVLLFTY